MRVGWLVSRQFCTMARANCGVEELVFAQQKKKHPAYCSNNISTLHLVCVKQEHEISCRMKE